MAGRSGRCAKRAAARACAPRQLPPAASSRRRPPPESPRAFGSRSLRAPPAAIILPPGRRQIRESRKGLATTASGLAVRRIGREKNASVEPGDPVPAAERERPVDLAPEKLEHPEHAVLARAGDTPKLRASDQNRARAERQSLDYVDSAPEAAVDHNRRPPADGLDNAGKRADRSDRAVELAPAMVGDDHAVGAA